MKKLNLISVFFIFQFYCLFSFSQCEYKIEFGKKKNELDINDLYFWGKKKDYYISFWFYEKEIINVIDLKIGKRNKTLKGTIDTTFSSEGNIEMINVTYKLNKKKVLNQEFLTISSKDLCVDFLIIPLFECYDFIDINFQHKYIIYHNNVFLIE